jgi:hypothetical protein
MGKTERDFPSLEAVGQFLASGIPVVQTAASTTFGGKDVLHPQPGQRWWESLMLARESRIKFRRSLHTSKLC